MKAIFRGFASGLMFGLATGHATRIDDWNDANYVMLTIVFTVSMVLVARWRWEED